MNYYDTPLRYPGGKTKIYSFVKTLMKNNFSTKPIYIEPFCGGAGLALKLLMNNKVEEIYLNDLDKNIYAFWFTIIKHPEALINFINQVPITIESWRQQKQIYLSNNNNVNLIKKGCATFFLNRTNYSGILTSGPIGGFSQQGNYKIDCRFKKMNLIRIIENIAVNNKKIKIFNLDIEDFINKLKLPLKDIFFYFDPPYVNQGQALYQNAFQKQKHETLANIIKNIKDAKWFLTYDNHALIKKLYQNYQQQLLPLRYSLKNKIQTKEIAIFSSNLLAPANNDN